MKIAGSSIPVARQQNFSCLSVLVFGLALALPVTHGSWQILSLCYFFWHNPAPTLVGVAGSGGVEWTHDRWLFGGLHPGVTMLLVLPWRRFWGKTKQAGGVTEVVNTLSSCELEFLGC